MNLELVAAILAVVIFMALKMMTELFARIELCTMGRRHRTMNGLQDDMAAVLAAPDPFMLEAMREVDALYPHTEAIAPAKQNSFLSIDCKIMEISAPDRRKLLSVLIENRSKLQLILVRYPVTCKSEDFYHILQEPPDVDDLILKLHILDFEERA